MDADATKSSLIHAFDALGRFGLPNLIYDFTESWRSNSTGGGVTRRDKLPVDVTADLKNKMTLLRGNIDGSDETPRRGAEGPGKDDKPLQLYSERR